MSAFSGTGSYRAKGRRLEGHSSVTSCLYIYLKTIGLQIGRKDVVMNETEIEQRGALMANATETLDAVKIFEETPLCDRQAVLREAVKTANARTNSDDILGKYLVNVEITDEQKVLELRLARPTTHGLGPVQFIPILKATIPTSKCPG